MYDNLSMELFKTKLDNYLNKNNECFSILTTDNLHKNGIDKIVKDTIT